MVIFLYFSRMRYLSFLILFSFLLIGCTTAKKEAYDLVIKNGKVIDVASGTIQKQHIYILDGRIEKVTDTVEENTFTSKETIDAAGKYLIPGLWDNHVHFRGGDSLVNANKNFLNLFLANGITTVRDAGGDLTTDVLLWNKEMSEGNLVGPNIFTSGPKIDGPNGTWAGSLEVENDIDIKNALDSLQAIPTDFVKLYDSRISGDAYLKTIIEAEKRNLITSGHMPFTVNLDATVDAGIDAIEHLYYIMKGCSSEEATITEKLVHKKIGFWDAMPALMNTYQDSTAQATFKNLNEHKVYVVPTLHIGKTLSYLDEVNHADDAYLKYMSAGIIKTYEGRINRVKNATKETIENRKHLDAFFGQLTKALNDAEVGLLAGSDSGAYNSYTYPGSSLHKELEEMVHNGLTPIEALRTSTYNGSKFLKKNADYGSISKGKIADIIVLDANPITNITNTKKIHSLIKTGKQYTKEQLELLLKKVEELTKENR